MTDMNNDIANNSIDSKEKNNNNKKEIDLFSMFFEYVELISVCLAIGIIFLAVFFRHSPVIGSSMTNTLFENDILILREIAYEPKQGDIVVCQSENYGLDTPLVKRVIALGGQKVEIDYQNWIVKVDGVTLEENYVRRVQETMRVSNYLPDTFIVPEGYIFVMGDNRNGSTDSRNSAVGFIDSNYVLGKVVARVYPISDLTIFD